MLAMNQTQGLTLRIFRHPTAFPASDGLFSGAVQPILSRPHPILNVHVGVADAHGRYYMFRLSDGGSRVHATAVYELQLCIDTGPAQPVSKPWRAFEHLPDDGLLYCQRGSGRILFAQLPLCEGEHGGVFLFGTHEGDVLCLVASRGLLVSGDSRGCVRLWSLDSGAQLDSRRHPGPGVQITAATFVGPLMVAVGTDQGDVTLYDISASRMEAVQRFQAGDGPVSALAARLTPAQAAAAAIADAPRRLDGGGVLAAPVGLPWRSGAGDSAGQGTETLLAVASVSGWLGVYAATGSGEATWRLVHMSGSLPGGCPFLSYSPDGDYLAVGAGDSLVVHEAASMQPIHQQHFPPGVALVAAGFLPPAAGGSTLVALPRGGTLAAALRLRLYAVPSAGQPLLIEVTRPLHDPPADTSDHYTSNRQHDQQQQHASDTRLPDPHAWPYATSSPQPEWRPATAPDPEDHLDWLCRAAAVGSGTEAEDAVSGAAPPPAPGGSPGWMGADWQTNGTGTSPHVASGPREAWPPVGGARTASLRSTGPAAASAWGWQAFAPEAASPVDSRNGNPLCVSTSPRAAPPPVAVIERVSVGEPWTSPGGRTAGGAAVGAAAATSRHATARSTPSAGLHAQGCSPTASPLLPAPPDHATSNARSSPGRSGGTGGGQAWTSPAGAAAGSSSSPPRHAGHHAPCTSDVVAGSAGGGGVNEAAPLHVWQAYRPTTQPAPRSWITGMPPRADFLPQPHPQQPSPQQQLPLGHHTPHTSATAPLSPPGQSGYLGVEDAPSVHSRQPRPGAETMGTVQEEEEEGLGAVGGMAAEGEEVEVDDSEPEMPHSGVLLPASPDGGLLYGDTADWRTGDLDMDPAGFRIHLPSQPPVNGPANALNQVPRTDDNTLPNTHHTSLLQSETLEANNPDLCRTAYGDPLQRTTYFGDQLASLWSGGVLPDENEGFTPGPAGPAPPAGVSGAGQEAGPVVSESGSAAVRRSQDPSQRLLRHLFDERRDLHEERTASEWESSREAHEMFTQIVPGGPAAARQQGGDDGAEDVGGEDEDEEELVPRGAGGLPQPEPQPPLSGGRHWGTATQLGEQDEQWREVRMLPGSAERPPRAHDDSGDGEAEDAASIPEGEEEDGVDGELEEERWAGWANADLLGGAGGRHSEAAAAAIGQKARPVRHPSSTPPPRQPPAALTAHRMQLSAFAAASNAIQPQLQHPHPHPSDQLDQERPRSRPQASLPGPQQYPIGDVRQVTACPQTNVSQEVITSTTAGVSCSTSSSPPPYRTGLSTAQRPALMSFRGYKPTHQQAMQAIRRKPAGVGSRAAVGKVAAVGVVEPAVRGSVGGRDGATGQEEEEEEEEEPGFETPRLRASPAGSPGIVESRLQSPAVLLGSPSGSITTHQSRATARETAAAAGPTTRRSGRQQTQSAAQAGLPLPPPGAESHGRESVDSAVSSVGAGGPGAGRKHLAHLRILRQSQQQMRRYGGVGGGGGSGTQPSTALPPRRDEHGVSLTTAAVGVVGNPHLQQQRQRPQQQFPAAGVTLTRTHRYPASSNRRSSAPGHLQQPPQHHRQQQECEEEEEEEELELGTPQYPAMNAAPAVTRAHRNGHDSGAPGDCAEADPYMADTLASAAYGRNGLGNNMSNVDNKHAIIAVAPTSGRRSLSPAAMPKFGSTALLLRRIAALEQTLNQPVLQPSSTAAPKTHSASAKPTLTGGRVVDARPARASGGRRPPSASGGEASLAPAATVAMGALSAPAREEAARRAATMVTHVPSGARLYRDLPSVEEEPPQPARLAKQLHPGWVASRQQKPDLMSLWNPEEHAKEICNTRGVALYVPPSPSEVALAALQLCWM